MKLLCILLAFSALAWADLSRARAEQNLEKRARLALENADETLKAANQAYDAGDTKQSFALLDEVAVSVDLALTSLKDTHKDPTKRYQPFKKAEVKTRNLLRRLASFSDEASISDRPPIEKVRIGVQKVHDELLQGVMEGWKK